MKELFGITWGSPGNIFILPLIIGIVALLIYRLVRVKSIVALLSGAWHTLLIRNFSMIRQIIKICLMSVGLLFLVIALLRPQWNKREEVVAQEGRDVFIALDVSRSMLATDCAPNRLSCAKEKIKQLLLFSGSAFVQCPLTDDYRAFAMFLDQVDVETISSGTTALDQALKQILKTFNTMDQRKNKLVVIFTDGEDFSSSLSGIKEEACKAGLHIFTVGVGTPEGAPIPLFDAMGTKIGHQKDGKGAVVISRLNDGILQTLAHDVGGTYVRLTADDTDMHTLVDHIHTFEKEYIEDKKYVQLEEQYPYFVFISFICFVIEWLL